MTDEEITMILQNMDWNSDPIEVPVPYILRNAVNSVDLGAWDEHVEHADWWENIIVNKAADTGFGHLVDSILTDGWDEDSAVGFDGFCITEGHHRLVAAILLGMDTVPVTSWGADGDKHLIAHWSEDYHPIILREG